MVVAAALVAACGGDDGNGGLATVSGGPANPYRVWAFSETDVWILDGTSTVHRYDGSTWSTLATPSTGGLACIYALSATDVWLCAGDEVLHYNGSTFTASDVATPTGLDGLTALWASSTSDVWVVGDDAIVAHYNGTSWSRTIVGSPFKTSIWGASPTDIYALGTFEMSHFDGSTWAEVALDDGGGGGDGQVWGTSASDVWQVSGSEDVWRYDGSAWTLTELAVHGGLAAIWGPSRDDVWVAGDAGLVAHYDGSWDVVMQQKLGAPYLQQLLSVHGTSADDVWIVGRQLGEGGSTGLIYHRGP